jgi:hypothetical protein
MWRPVGQQSGVAFVTLWKELTQYIINHAKAPQAPYVPLATISLVPGLWLPPADRRANRRRKPAVLGGTEGTPPQAITKPGF